MAGTIFSDAMKSQNRQAEHRYHWYTGTSFTSQVDINDEDEGSSINEFVPDFCIFDNENLTYLIIEVAFTQTRTEILDKIQRRMKNMEQVVGAIVIDLVETPTYKSPKRPSRPDDFIPVEEWKTITEALPYGPITRRIDNLTWIGSINCTIDVIIKNDDANLGVQQVV
jgi:hypothetical protein